ncbi:MAG: glycosyl transferase [Elusimicrobia bacterium CG06_land_8_20_14_3_00_38_11]|nr:MAG: glycosyl transferase [Elusimicrobia bacterium CG06_land_8_20_14_3_00_38_11]
MSDFGKVSVIMPVFNEKSTIAKVIEKVTSLSPKEIIIVDDYSTDGTRDIINQLKIKNSKLKILLHEKNQGKGAAIRTALKHVTGEIVTIQDADLEYNPEEIRNLIVPLIEGKSLVVYGSRFLQLKEKRYVHHYLGNKLLNFLTNFIYGSNLTDMETCYKVFRSDVILSLNLKANRFEFEPEVTAKILKRKIPIYELPIFYKSRTYKEGKKIGWRDGVTALLTLIKYRFTD